MKRRSTTPVSKGLVTRSTLVAAAALMAIAAPLSIVPQVYADPFDDQIRAIQREIDAYQSEAQKFRSQADSLQRQLDIITNEKAQIQAQVDLSQAKFDKLQIDIAKTEKDIQSNKDALGETIANIYVDDKISPLEMLASSKNIGDYVDKQEYRSSIRDSLTSTIDKIKQLKKELEAQKKETERILGDQTNARNALAAKEAEQQQLVNETRGQEAAYQGLAAQSNARKLEVQRQQQAAIEAAMRRAGGGSYNLLPGDPNKGGYRWDGACWVDSNAISHGGYIPIPAGSIEGTVDPNQVGRDPLGYGCRQCVSYTAWKVLQKTGRAFQYWGNANMWPSSARNNGFSTGSTPRVDSVGVISAGQYGHVVWVEAVNGDGTIDISQYNYLNAGGSGWGHYSKMRVSAATYDTYIYF